MLQYSASAAHAQAGSYPIRGEAEHGHCQGRSIANLFGVFLAQGMTKEPAGSADEDNDIRWRIRSVRFPYAKESKSIVLYCTFSAHQKINLLQ